MASQTVDLRTSDDLRRAEKNTKKDKGSSVTSRKIRWGWGIFAALVMSLLSFYPQIDLWLTRGNDWQGAYAAVLHDEETYAAYINGLISGRPRCLDPLARYEADKPLSETLFSIQFVPAYLIALPARALGLSAAQAFMILTPLIAFFSTLAIFYLLASVTGDEALAAVGALCILCFGTAASRDGIAFDWMGPAARWFGYLPFLRRYQPGASFPLFFVFVWLVWQVFTRSARGAWRASLAAGVIFAVLVFSYFFLWTAAAAWLACFTLVWLAARRTEWQLVVRRLIPIAVIGASALAGYAFMLAHRDSRMDSVQVLTATHAPDFYRLPQLIGVLVIGGLIWGLRKGWALWRDPAVLLALSLALMTIIVFNQQILTGRSIQPYHYESFIVNYVSLLAVVVASVILWRGRTQQITRRIPIWLTAVLAGAALIWGGLEVRAATSAFHMRYVAYDTFVPVAKRLTALAAEHGKSPNDRELLFTTDTHIADNVAVYAPQTLLWSTYMPVVGGLSPAEQQERFFQFSYYSGKTPKELEQELKDYNFITVTALFGYERQIPRLTNHFQWLTDEERHEKARLYADYIARFNRQRAARAALSYVLVVTQAPFDFSNLDRWYKRDSGERIGPFTLYQVQLHSTTP